MMIKPETEWSFADRPDIFRICRELGEAGCALGTATRVDGVITLVNVAARRWPYKSLSLVGSESSFHVFGPWHCLKGDHVRALLAVHPVTVRGYK
jgi:hypothetical protein